MHMTCQATRASSGRRRAAIVNAMTIDVEDYFHVSVFDGLVPRHRWEQHGEPRRARTPSGCSSIFNESGVQATFFVLGWVAERFPQLVRAIAAEGHEIASHGYAHRLVYDLTPRQFRDDIRRSKDLLEDGDVRAGRSATARRATRSRRGRCGRSTC